MAAKSTPSKTRRSKAEIQEEFEKIQEESQQSKLDLSTKADALAKHKESEIRQAVQGTTVEGIVQGLAQLGLDVSKTLSGLSAQLVEQAELLFSMREAVALEAKELNRLHKTDIAATALDQLVEEYEAKKKELEAEVETTQAQWIEEQRLRDREQKEFEENLKKVRAREKEEFEYQKANERKKEQDQYEVGCVTLERKNKEKQETLEKSWAQREGDLKAKESEFTQFKGEVSQFPERLKKEITQAVSEATKTLESKHQQEMLVAQKDIESEKRLADLKVKSLEETATRQFTQIESLQLKLEEAKKQVQDIAVKAIEGASGARALAHVNQIAMEQAKPRSPTS